MVLNPTIYVIDDNKEVTESLRWLLQSVNYQVVTFNDAKSFVAHYQPNQHGCLVSDVRMPEISGLELQKILLKQHQTIPIIFITAYADVETAVRAMKLGAVDFLTKPVNNQILLEAINKALRLDIAQKEQQLRSAKASSLIDKLTPRELEIMRLLAKGKLNKNIATILGISQKTVELHRSHVMRKLKAKSVAQLIRIFLDSSVNLKI